jgi:bla regulator protein blaR1
MWTATSVGQSFDVVSVKRSTGGNIGVGAAGGRFTATNVSLGQLIMLAFPDGDRERMPDQIQGRPDWVGKDRFDVIATGGPASLDTRTPGAVSPRPGEDLNMTRAMLRNLLADRFGLVVRHESRELPIYALRRVSQDRVGPQLRPAECAASGAPSDRTRPACGGFNAATIPMMSGPGKMNARGVTMPMLTTMLSAMMAVGRIVDDRTGLSGAFDIELSFTPAPPPSLDNANTGTPLPGPSIFTALQEQLGLKLEAATGPVDVLVIERVEPPREN